MLKTIHRMQKDQKGFTLVELLVVIAIIAILAAIATTQFSGYRAKGIEASMVSDARNIATAMEAVYTDCQAYPSLNETTGPAANVPLTPPGTCTATMSVNISTGNRASATGGPTFTVTINNNNAREGRRQHTLNNEGVTEWR